MHHFESSILGPCLVFQETRPKVNLAIEESQRRLALWAGMLSRPLHRRTAVNEETAGT